MELHVDGSEQRRGAGVVAPQHPQFDELVRAEQRLRLGERLRRHLVIAENLAAELDHRGVGFVEAGRGLPVLDDVDDARFDPLLQRLWLVRRPFEPAVHLARGPQDRDLADARGKARLEALVAVWRASILVRLPTRETELDQTHPFWHGGVLRLYTVH